MINFEDFRTGRTILIGSAMIDLKSLKTEKKTVRGSARYTPTFYRVLKEVARRKNTTMIEIIENLVIQEYLKLQEDQNNG